MLLAIISDTHLPRGRRRLPDLCLEWLRRADAIVHAGDLSTVAVLDDLRALGPPVTAVLGNVDEPALAARLPALASVELDNGTRLGVIHDAGPAAGRLERMRARFPGCGAVVFGHSHIPLLACSPDDGLTIFNPGSPTDRRRQPEHTMGLARTRGDGGLDFEHLSLGA